MLLFLCIESTSAGARLALVAGIRRPTGEALRAFASGTRRFIGVTTVIGLVTGIIDTVVLALLGIPAALLWGMLVFVTNYVPYVGFWIGLAPPALLALLVGGGPLLAVVAVVFLVINFVLTSLVQPYFIGDAVGLSVTVTVVALLMWGWLLGPVGAVLSVPLTLLVKAVLVDHDPRAVWADALLSSTRRVDQLRTGQRRTPTSSGRRDPSYAMRGTARIVVAPRVRAGGRRHWRPPQESHQDPDAPGLGQPVPREEAWAVEADEVEMGPVNESADTTRRSCSRRASTRIRGAARLPRRLRLLDPDAGAPVVRRRGRAGFNGSYERLDRVR